MLSLFEICNAIESGKPVIIPTETVYGLAGRADSPELIQKICQIKQRSITHPLAWLCPKDYNFSKLVSTWPKEARILAGKFWPGPLTMIFPRAKNLKAGQAGQTLGLRVPAHPLTLEILKL